MAYELDTNNLEAAEYYIASLFYSKDIATAEALIKEASPELKAKLAASDFVIGAVNAAGAFEYLATLYETRIAADATNPQNWASLAYVYYKLKQNDKAVSTLERAIVAVPAFAPTAQCFSANIKKGVSPEVGCQ